VTSIGNQAFANIPSLQSILILGSSLSSMGNGSFEWSCRSDVMVQFESSWLKSVYRSKLESWGCVNRGRNASEIAMVSTSLDLCPAGRYRLRHGHECTYTYTTRCECAM
jgi:hypothetical protein